MHVYTMDWVYKLAALDTGIRYSNFGCSHKTELQAGVEILKDVKQWEKQEEARKARSLEQVLHFKSMREAQVVEKQARRQRVCSHVVIPAVAEAGAA